MSDISNGPHTAEIKVSPELNSFYRLYVENLSFAFSASRGYLHPLSTSVQPCLTLLHLFFSALLLLSDMDIGDYTGPM